MNRKTFLMCAVVVMAPGLSVLATGPDVVYTDCNDVTHYTPVGNIHAYAIGSVTCNIGNADLIWASSGSPGLAMNAFRLYQGRFEQIGMGWVKTACCAGAGNGCGLSCNNVGGNMLGAGCRDVYSGGFNGGQTRLAPRSSINAFSGVFSGFSPGGGSNIDRRIQILQSDMESANFPGALYFVEGAYVGSDDAAASNGLNNSSYKRVTIGADFSMTPTGSIALSIPAIFAWRDNGLGAGVSDPNVHVMTVDIPNEGRVFVAYKVSGSAGAYHYEFAIQNLNSDRSIGSVTVPATGAVLSNIGYHDVKVHSGEIYSTANWTMSQASGNVVWACQTFAQNQNANALRWGTLYNFRFDATTAPIAGNMTLGLFKPGTPSTVSVAIAVPGPADCNTNGTLDTADIAAGTSNDCNTNSIPDECEDCNSNGIADDCEGTDCNTNGVRDFCEFAGQDCNANGVLDVCELAGHDCNTNRVYDSCELAGHDCDANGVPDACQPDCDGDGTIDACAGRPDCNTNGVPDNCDVSPHPGNLSYTTGPISLAIPDHNALGTSSTLMATLGGPVTDVNVTVHIQHPDVSQLLLGLTHGSTTVTLWNSRCPGSSNLDVTFDDQGTTLNCSNLSGTYRPASTGTGTLSTFNTQNSLGAWTLRVIDLTTGGVGTVTGWSLNVVIPNIPPTSPDVNSNGIPDECECACRGDTNLDHIVDGADIQGFVTMFLSGTYQMCADIDRNGTLNGEDLGMFVAVVLNAGNPCP